MFCWLQKINLSKLMFTLCPVWLCYCPDRHICPYFIIYTCPRIFLLPITNIFYSFYIRREASTAESKHYRHHHEPEFACWSTWGSGQIEKEVFGEWPAVFLELEFWFPARRMKTGASRAWGWGTSSCEFKEVRGKEIKHEK